MSEENVQTTGLVQQSIQTLTNPKAYFTEMPVTGGFGAPIIKALVYGVIAGLFGFLWSFLGFSALGGLGALFGGGAGIMIFVMSLVGALIGLFIGAVIMLIISAICGGSTDFETNLRVTASLMVLSPVGALFGFLSGFSFMLGAVVGLLINLYGLWLLYHALGNSLKAKPGASKVVSMILGVIYILVFISGLAAAKLVDQYSGMIEDVTSEEMKEMAKKIAVEAGGEEAGEAVEKAYDMATEGQEGYNLEMANGDKMEAPSMAQLMASLGKLGADNDFCILTYDNDFIQAAYSEKGYTVQFKDATGQYEATELHPQSTVMMMFTSYLNSEDDWQNMAQWEEMQ